MTGLRVDNDWYVPESDLEFRYLRSRGPGGQHVNKVSTRVELRFKLAASRSLNPAQKRRLREAFPSHVTGAGDFIITSDRHRSQRQNRQDALDKLAERLRGIRHPPRRRIATTLPKSAQRRRLERKRQRGEVKKHRRHVERE